MKWCVFLLLLVVLLTPGSEGRRRGRMRKRQRQRDSSGRGTDLSSPDAWRSFLSRLLGRTGSNRFGMGVDENTFFDFELGFNRQSKPWWQGPNICKSESVKETNATAGGEGTISRHFSFHSQVCDETDTAYKCVTTSQMYGGKKITTELFECCLGYTRKEREFGCPRELKLRNLVDTARSLNLKEFLRATDSVSLTEELRQANFTIFAPVDDAFKDVASYIPDLDNIMPKDMGSVVMVSKPVSNLVVSDMQNLLLGHLAVGQYKTSNLQDEQLVETGSPYKAKVRVNFYIGPQKLMTANCIRVLSADNVATNGVIHTVESLLQPITDSIVGIVSKTPHLGYLKTALARANMVQTFRGEGQFTIFAPTDNAFRKMAPELLDKLLKGDEECLQKVLKNHILPNVICSAVIQGKAKSENMLGAYLNLTRDENDKLFVNDGQIVQKDLMATNGVIHIIDDVLVPDEALRVVDIVEKRGLTRVQQLLEKAGLANDLQKAGNITFFAPSNEAIENLPNETTHALETDPAFLKQVLQYHAVPARISTGSSLYNNLQLDTLNGKAKIRINEYSSFPFRHHWSQTAQCAPISAKDIKSCNGMVNIIDKVMLPPQGNVFDVIAQDARFSELVKLLKMSGIADDLQAERPLTIFAPTNEAFKVLGSRTVKMLTENPEELKVVLKNHVAKDALCCAGIFEGGYFGRPRVRTLSGRGFRLHRKGDYSLKVGPAKLTECDLSASNGVVHVIDRVLVEGERQDFRQWFLGPHHWADNNRWSPWRFHRI